VRAQREYAGTVLASVMIELDCAGSLVEVVATRISRPAVRELAARTRRKATASKVAGDLAIRGKAMPVTLEVTFEGVGKDPWGKQRAAPEFRIHERPIS
jgi:hypothetical protein